MSQYAFIPCWCCGSETICNCWEDFTKCEECGHCGVHHVAKCGYGSWCRKRQVDYSWQDYQEWKLHQEKET